MNANEQAKLQQFLGMLLDGDMDLGFAALPLIAIYNKAKSEKIDFWQLLLTEPSIADRIVKSMRKHAAKLPESAITGLRLLINSHAEAKVQAKAETEAVKKSAFARPGAVSEEDAP